MPHPYHWDKDKHARHRFLDIAVPISLLLIFYFFYNKGVVSPSEAIKTTGLWGISLLALTLAIGPLSRIHLIFEHLKAHRKVWGITSFWAILIHMLLVFNFYWKLDLSRLWDIENPRYLGTVTGLLAVLILALVTFTSQENMIKKMNPKMWKIIQTTSYLALALAVLHFYYMEQQNGVLVIKRIFGQFAFWGAIVVLVLRLLVIFLPKRKV